MFKIQHKRNSQRVLTVHGIKEDDFYNKFFLTYQHGSWAWERAIDYIPYEEVRV